MSRTGEGGRVGSDKENSICYGEVFVNKKCLFSRYHCSSSLTMRLAKY